MSFFYNVCCCRKSKESCCETPEGS
jgi:hypothetical protein